MALPPPQVDVHQSNSNGTSRNSSEDRLAELTAQATLKYSIKDYDAAAELYSEATELQAELNGEMSPKNADLLYAYGRCLYHVAVKKSDVLGSKVAGEPSAQEPKRPKPKSTQGESHQASAVEPEDRTAEEIVAQVVQEKSGAKETDDDDKKATDGKPFFQFTGDENFDESENDEDADGSDAEDGDEGAAEDDDFANAYEVLDLARILLLRRLEEAEGTEGKGKGTGDSEEVKQIKERLADTHDLQAEISLEGERFPAAVVDLKAALALKKELYPKDSSLMAEAHYKLSLALEFSSVTQQKEEDGEAGLSKHAHVDEAMREEAAGEMEAAIESCKLRIAKEEAKLASRAADANDHDGPKVTEETIADVKDMVADMEQRLVELRQPPVSINDPTGTGTIDGATPLSGILGSILGESAAEQKARLEEATKGAHDLTNLVKRKKPAAEGRQEELQTTAANGNGKRKLEPVEDQDEAVDTKRRK